MIDSDGSSFRDDHNGSEDDEDDERERGSTGKNNSTASATTSTEGVQNVVKDVTSAKSGRKKRTVPTPEEALDREAKPLEEGELDTLLPAELPGDQYDDDWTGSDEEEQPQEVEDGEYALLAINDKSSTMKSLFKVTLRFFRMTPLEIISPKHYLNPFCLSLKTLIVHPIFNKNFKLLVMVIKYAAIVRTNDCRTWPYKKPSDDRFFTVIGKVIEANKGKNKSMVDIHRRARGILKAEEKEIPSFSRFMKNLEDEFAATKKSDSVRPITEARGPFTAYSIGKNELTMMVKALNGVSMLGALVFHQADLIGEIVLGSRGYTKNDLPAHKHVLRYTKPSILANRRYEAKMTKKAQR
ncbi:hypothetical protein LY76DRAFT_633866 [Colletotrichum caudatum]|nr:hypothetical protein LY76DRAFT_633866 [Colletotrichum caudatum]